MRYEMWLRRIESRTYSLIGLSGFFAARKVVCDDFSGEMQSDFRTVLISIKLGLRGISDTMVVGYYQDIVDVKHEFSRKVRTIAKGLTVFFRHLEFMNPIKYGLFSYQYFCHKLLRWLVPAFLIVTIVSNILLTVQSVWWAILLIFHLAIYFFAFCVWVRGGSWLGVVTKIPNYFATVNLSILIAWIGFMKGERIVMWSPSKR